MTCGMSFCRQHNLFHNSVIITYNFIGLYVDFVTVLDDQAFLWLSWTSSGTALSKTQLTEEYWLALMVVLLILPTLKTLDSAGTGHLCQQRSLLFTVIHLA